MPTTTSFRYLHVLELDPVSPAIFHLQTSIPETTIYSGRVPSGNAGEHKWLLQQAESGDYHAMEKLGAHLLAQESNEERVKGLSWLMRAAQAGAPSAQLQAAEHLLDGERVPPCLEEGEKWLRKAAASGYRRAVTNLALRMMDGAGVEKSPDQGLEMLSSAAIDGSVVASAILAARCFENHESSEEAAFAYLQRCRAAEPEQVVKIALFLYLDSLNAPARLSRRRLAQYAGRLLEHMMRWGAATAAINLAYLLRRGELPLESFPRLADVLDPLVGSGDPFVLMNQALRVAAGVDVVPDWRAADALVARLTDVQTILNWWRARGHAGDVEGHMVIAWLLRHALRIDPDGLGLRARTKLARDAGWKIPDWFVYSKF